MPRCEGVDIGMTSISLEGVLVEVPDLLTEPLASCDIYVSPDFSTGIGDDCSSNGSFGQDKLRGGLSNGLVLGPSKGLVLLCRGTAGTLGVPPFIASEVTGVVHGNILPRRRLFLALACSVFVPSALQYRSRGLIVLTLSLEVPSADLKASGASGLGSFSLGIVLVTMQPRGDAALSTVFAA